MVPSAEMEIAVSEAVVHFIPQMASEWAGERNYGERREGGGRRCGVRS